MAESVYHPPVVWMSVVVFAVTLLLSGAIYAAVLALAKGERARAFKAMSPVMSSPLAVVFGLIIAFLASQVWTDVARANDAVIREANALRSVVVLAAYYPKEQETRMRAFVRRHIQNAVNGVMARHGQAPRQSAADNSGLQRGTPARPVHRSPE